MKNITESLEMSAEAHFLTGDCPVCGAPKYTWEKRPDGWHCPNCNSNFDKDGSVKSQSEIEKNAIQREGYFDKRIAAATSSAEEVDSSKELQQEAFIFKPGVAGEVGGIEEVPDELQILYDDLPSEPDEEHTYRARIIYRGEGQTREFKAINSVEAMKKAATWVFPNNITDNGIRSKGGAIIPFTANSLGELFIMHRISGNPEQVVWIKNTDSGSYAYDQEGKHFTQKPSYKRESVEEAETEEPGDVTGFKKPISREKEIVEDIERLLDSNDADSYEVILDRYPGVEFAGFDWKETASYYEDSFDDVEDIDEDELDSDDYGYRPGESPEELWIDDMEDRDYVVYKDKRFEGSDSVGYFAIPSSLLE